MLTTFRTRIATVAVATTALAVLAVPGVAAAHTDGDTGAFHHRHRRHHHTLTDAEKACLAGQGFTLPLARDQVRDPATWLRFVAARRTCGILPTRPAPAAVAPTPALTVQPQAATPPHPSWPDLPESADSPGATHSWGGFDHHDGAEHHGGFDGAGGRSGSGGGWGHARGGFGH